MSSRTQRYPVVVRDFLECGNLSPLLSATGFVNGRQDDVHTVSARLGTRTIESIQLLHKAVTSHRTPKGEVLPCLSIFAGNS
jgi:hypothetical protein